MDPVTYFILHIPKCAGTTVENHLAAGLGDRFALAPRWKNVMRNIIGNRYYFSPAEQQAVTRLRAVSGHSLSVSLRRALPGRTIRECVLLRDPTSYFLSFYNYRIARHQLYGQPLPPDFAAWYWAQRKNPISRFILNRYYETGHPQIMSLNSRRRLRFLNQRLADFHFVGSLAHTNSLLQSVSRELAISEDIKAANVGAVRAFTRADMSADQLARIEQDNAVDSTLYSLWRDRCFTPGAAPGCREAEAALSARDAGVYFMNEITSAARKKLIR